MQRNRTSTSLPYSPGPQAGTLRADDGTIHKVPEGWSLLPPGDAGLTRRVKAAGEFWLVQERKGRRVFSRGLWAPDATIERIRNDLQNERGTEGYAKKRVAATARRDRVQEEYVEDFHGSVVAFLAFPLQYEDLAQKMAQAITAHATPIGSGTVARTKRIPIARRAEAAVIAWMRHQTTGYDGMVIPRIKGKRREVRRMLAERSKDLLRQYRKGESPRSDCPLGKALQE